MERARWAGYIGSAQMIIRILQSKGRKDRHVMLPAEVLGLLRQWWRCYLGMTAALRRNTAGSSPFAVDIRPLTTSQFSRLSKQAAKASRLHTARFPFLSSVIASPPICSSAARGVLFGEPATDLTFVPGM